MEDQHAAIHPFRAALLLVPRPLQSAVDRYNLRDGQSFRLQYALGTRPLLAGVELRNPHSNSVMRATQPLERGIGKHVRGYSGADAPVRSPASPHPPDDCGHRRQRYQRQPLGHPRSHPRLRNQR
jgi:hypothetical protein